MEYSIRKSALSVQWPSCLPSSSHCPQISPHHLLVDYQDSHLTVLSASFLCPHQSILHHLAKKYVTSIYDRLCKFFITLPNTITGIFRDKRHLKIPMDLTFKENYLKGGLSTKFTPIGSVSRRVRVCVCKSLLDKNLALVCFLLL